MHTGLLHYTPGGVYMVCHVLWRCDVHVVHTLLADLTLWWFGLPRGWYVCVCLCVCVSVCLSVRACLGLTLTFIVAVTAVTRLCRVRLSRSDNNFITNDLCLRHRPYLGEVRRSSSQIKRKSHRNKNVAKVRSFGAVACRATIYG